MWGVDLNVKGGIDNAISRIYTVYTELRIKGGTGKCYS